MHTKKPKFKLSSSIGICHHSGFLSVAGVKKMQKPLKRRKGLLNFPGYNPQLRDTRPGSEGRNNEETVALSLAFAEISFLYNLEQPTQDGGQVVPPTSHNGDNPLQTCLEINLTKIIIQFILFFFQEI